MKSSFFSESPMKNFGLFFVVILLLSAVVAAQRFPEYQVRLASEYPSCQTKNEISIAIEPVNDEEKQKTHLGTKLSPHGFLPVLVVLENGSSSSSVLLHRALVTYHIED